MVVKRSRFLCLPLLFLLLDARVLPEEPEVEAYFSPYDYVDQVLLAELGKATSRVWLAYYNIDVPAFKEKFLELMAKGIDLKILMDARIQLKPYYTLDDEMIAAGLPLIRIPNIRGAHATMHNKFAVIDSATVILGSGNLSHTGTISNHESHLLVRSKKLSTIYETEFQEILDTAAYMNSIFTPAEMENFLVNSVYPAWWTSDNPAVGEIKKKIWQMNKPTWASTQPASWLRAYFSPEDKLDKLVLAELDKAEKEVLVAMFSFSFVELAAKLVELKGRGVEVEVIVDENQAASPHMTEVLATLSTGGGKVVRAQNWNGIYAAMHHKYALIDRKTVVAGAYNWTYGATYKNDENNLIIVSEPLARKFYQDFVQLMARYRPDFHPSQYDMPYYYNATPKATFVVWENSTHWGEDVAVVGSLPELGGWDPAKALPLRTGGSVFPNWAGSVDLPAGVPFEFKFIVRRLGPGGPTVEWESGGNYPWAVPAEGFSVTWQSGFRR